jgi:hypothetical protein
LTDLNVEAPLAAVDLDQLGPHPGHLELHVEDAVPQPQAVAALRGGRNHYHLLVPATESAIIISAVHEKKPIRMNQKVAILLGVRVRYQLLVSETDQPILDRKRNVIANIDTMRCT